jgi:capsule polysaccharide export protein KpsE/RkpR
MGERKQRTPAEIIAETEAKLAKLRVKQAKQGAMSDPTLAPLVAELEAMRKSIREAKKGLGDGPQSFNARVAKHEIWIEKIETERSFAQDTMDEAEARKSEIEAEITQAVNGLVETPSLSTGE